MPPARRLESPKVENVDIPPPLVVCDLSPEAPTPEEALLASKPLNARRAAAIGAGLATLCMIALYMTMRPGTETPSSVDQAEAAPPSLPAPTPPVIVPAAVAPAASGTAAQPPAPKEGRWIFTGVIYDLLSTRGVFGVGLIFIDGAGQEVGATESDEEGRYRVTLPAVEPEGYSVRIMHEDYSDRHIDESEASSLRTGDLKQRRLLMRSGVRTSAWIGVVGQRTRRDIGLIPLSAGKP